MVTIPILTPSSYVGSHTSSPISTSPFCACVIPFSYSFFSYLTHTCGNRPAAQPLPTYIDIVSEVLYDEKQQH